MNTRNIDAAGRPETIATARQHMAAEKFVVHRRERVAAIASSLDWGREAASRQKICYVAVNGVVAPVLR